VRSRPVRAGSPFLHIYSGETESRRSLPARFLRYLRTAARGILRGEGEEGRITRLRVQRLIECAKSRDGKIAPRHETKRFQSDARCARFANLVEKRSLLRAANGSAL